MQHIGLKLHLFLIWEIPLRISHVCCSHQPLAWTMIKLTDDISASGYHCVFIESADKVTVSGVVKLKWCVRVKVNSLCEWCISHILWPPKQLMASIDMALPYFFRIFRSHHYKSYAFLMALRWIYVPVRLILRSGGSPLSHPYLKLKGFAIRAVTALNTGSCTDNTGATIDDRFDIMTTLDFQ